MGLGVLPALRVFGRFSPSTRGRCDELPVETQLPRGCRGSPPGGTGFVAEKTLGLPVRLGSGNLRSFSSGDPQQERSDMDTQRAFATTNWTVVFQAKDADPEVSGAAFNQICLAYRAPIYAYLRRQGHSPADAEDLTHDFYAHLMRQSFLDHLHHRDGRFRSFLLKFLKHFLSDVRDKARARKRGGGVEHVSFDDSEASLHKSMEPAGGLTPDQVYELKWAQTVMERSWSRLGDCYRADGNADLFEVLKDLGTDNEAGISYAAAGANLGLAEGTIKSAMHRMRLRHREIIRDEIAQTVSHPGEVDAEIRNLLMVLGS